MINIRKLETELWEAADLLRADSKVTSQEYCMPVLGLIVFCLLVRDQEWLSACPKAIPTKRSTDFGKIAHVFQSSMKELINIRRV